MQVIVQGKQIDIGDSLRSHVEDHLSATVHKYFHKPIDGTVLFSKDSFRIKAEILVHASNGIRLESSAEDEDIHQAFDKALAKISTRLRRYKNKLRDNHHTTHKEEMAQINYVINTAHLENGKDHDDIEPMVIADLDHDIETMTVSEAVMRMDLGKATAFMFRNSAHGDFNMVYRRLDGNVGWVDPKGNEKLVPKS